MKRLLIVLFVVALAVPAVAMGSWLGGGDDDAACQPGMRKVGSNCLPDKKQMQSPADGPYYEMPNMSIDNVPVDPSGQTGQAPFAHPFAGAGGTCSYQEVVMAMAGQVPNTCGFKCDVYIKANEPNPAGVDICQPQDIVMIQNGSKEKTCKIVCIDQGKADEAGDDQGDVTQGSDTGAGSDDAAAGSDVSDPEQEDLFGNPADVPGSAQIADMCPPDFQMRVIKAQDKADLYGESLAEADRKEFDETGKQGFRANIFRDATSIYAKIPMVNCLSNEQQAKDIWFDGYRYMQNKALSYPYGGDILIKAQAYHKESKALYDSCPTLTRNFSCNPYLSNKVLGVDISQMPASGGMKVMRDNARQQELTNLKKTIDAFKQQVNSSGY